MTRKKTCVFTIHMMLRCLRLQMTQREHFHFFKSCQSRQSRQSYELDDKRDQA